MGVGDGHSSQGLSTQGKLSIGDIKEPQVTFPSQAETLILFPKVKSR